MGGAASVLGSLVEYEGRSSNVMTKSPIGLQDDEAPEALLVAVAASLVAGAAEIVSVRVAIGWVTTIEAVTMMLVASALEAGADVFEPGVGCMDVGGVELKLDATDSEAVTEADTSLVV